MTDLPDILEPYREIIHPAALILPRPSSEDYADLKASIKQHGMLAQITIFIDGNNEHWLLDGVSRLQALLDLGWRQQDLLDVKGWQLDHKKVYARNGADPYEIALGLNVRRRHLNAEQKRDVIARLRQHRPDLSDRAIAAMTGVSHPTVAAARRETELMESTFHKPKTEAISTTALTSEPLVNQPERREISGRRARGRRPGARPLTPPKIVALHPPQRRHCPHCNGTGWLHDT